MGTNTSPCRSWGTCQIVQQEVWRKEKGSKKVEKGWRL